MRGIRGIGCVAGGLAMLLAGTQASAAGCWRADEAGAAQVRELQSMLMVEALRCRASGIDILADYDSFVSAQRATLVASNARLHGHFAPGSTDDAGYDHFTTALASEYGAGGAADLGCEAAAALANDAAMAGDADGLARLAAANVPPRDLPGGFCAAPASASILAIAAAEPTAAAPVLGSGTGPILIAAAIRVASEAP